MNGDIFRPRRGCQRQRTASAGILRANHCRFSILPPLN
jgi:hypothetical protein